MNKTTGEKLENHVHKPHYWASYIILVSTIIVLGVISWAVAGLVKEQRQIVATQLESAERAEERTRELKNEIEELLDEAVEEMRDEVSDQIDQRIETNEAIERLENLIEELKEDE